MDQSQKVPTGYTLKKFKMLRLTLSYGIALNIIHHRHRGVHIVYLYILMRKQISRGAVVGSSFTAVQSLVPRDVSMSPNRMGS
jgi:hypothetical protein